MLVKAEHPVVLFLALLVHIGTPAGRLALRAEADEVVVGALGHTNALDVADDIEDEGEVIPERGLKASTDAFEIRATEQLVPRRIEEVLVKELPRAGAELRLARIHARGLALELRGVLIGVAIVGLDIKAGDNEVEAIRLGDVHEVGEHGGLCPVVAVDEVDELAASTVEGDVACSGSALVFRVDDVNADVALRQAIGDLTRTISRAIVHNDELEVPERLVLNALDGTADEAIHVIGRYDYRDLRDSLLHVSHLCPSVAR